MDTVIHLENVSVCYKNTPAIEQVNLTVERGDFLGIMGPNGGGKTTLVKAVLGLVPLSGGSITICGKDHLKSRGRAGYVPQFSFVDRTFPVTALEVVLTGLLKGGLHPFFRYTKQQKEEALNCMEQVGIAHLAGRNLPGLSGGEFQRLLIARALAVHPEILILDEPTASVDPAFRQEIYTLLGKLNETVTILLITHDMNAIAREVKTIACLNRTLVYHGEPHLTEHIINKLYNCPIDLVAHGVPHRVLEQHEGDR
jgi:zinc transport system ATP-binding protein